jgi:hypothetical protein
MQPLHYLLKRYVKCLILMTLVIYLLQVQLSGTAFQQRLISGSTTHPQQHAQQMRTASSGPQKIIVHQIPASPQQQVQSQLTATPNNVSMPQQIIITAQPQQPAPQPAQQISLQQLQQVSIKVCVSADFLLWHI